jgi:HD-GYP domain-containing protein (c-di-GMP phosphodiesterase class II)
MDFSTETHFSSSIEKFQTYREIESLEIALAENIHPYIKHQTQVALEAMGRFLQVEHSYICYKESTAKIHQLIQWNSSHTNSQVLTLSDKQTHYRLFRKTPPAELVFVKNGSTFSKKDIEIFSNVGITSTLHVPLFLEDSVHGWLGFHGFKQEIDISKGLLLLIWMFGLIVMGGLEKPTIDTGELNASNSFWKYVRQFDYSWFTNGHSQQLIEITRKIAENIGFSEQMLDVMLQGAFLHDVGKFTIPDEILEKKNKLTAEEIKVIRYHPSIAYNLLSQIPILKNATEIPHCHHEYWNGSGYPRGLKGEEIPLEARIFAIADVYDALCSDRPYREAWKKSDAIEYIKFNAGSQFDPEVVPEFLKVVGES